MFSEKIVFVNEGLVGESIVKVDMLMGKSIVNGGFTAKLNVVNEGVFRGRIVFVNGGVS